MLRTLKKLIEWVNRELQSGLKELRTFIPEHFIYNMLHQSQKSQNAFLDPATTECYERQTTEIRTIYKPI